MINGNTIEEKALTLLSDNTDCVLASVSEDGYPRCCYLGVMGHDSFRELYFSTGATGTKARHFRANPKASVAYRGKGNDGVTLVGTIEFVTDREKLEGFWADWMYEHFPKGIDDPDYCILKFAAFEATFWIDGEFVTKKY